MSEEKQHRSLFNRHKEDGGEQVPKSADQYGEGIAQTAEKEKALKGEKYHKHMEELAAGGAVATGGFALHEKHEEKKDPENARRHKIEEEAAAAATVGETGFGFHEHHDEKESKEEEKKAEGKKQHHLF